MAASASESGSKCSKRVCLFHSDETRDLAERIVAQSDCIELRSINWNSPAVIFEQLSVIYALPKLFVSSFTLVLPFFPTGTSERMEDEGDVATAFTLARILSNIPASRGGPTSLVTFDIHALQERFYFGDTILPCFESGIPLLKNRLQALPDSDNISIAFPDDGAWKRFHKQLQHYPTIVCNKVRMGDKRIVRIKEGDAEGRHVVIVDDLVQSGGTLIECQKVLAAHGAAKISAYVTHGIFPKSSWKRFKLDTKGDPAEGFSYFWITDSCGLTVKERGHVLAIERLAPRLAALRIELCPYHMTVGCFWKVYFVLLHSRLSKHDAYLLSSPQVMEAIALWMKELQNQTNSTKTGRGDILQEPSTSSFYHHAPPEFLSPRIYAFEPPSIMYRDVETVSQNVQFIDKAVIEEEPIQKIDKNSGSLRPTLKDDDDDDDWPEEEDCGHKWAPMYTVNEDDVSFSDLEGDDDISSIVLKSNSTTSKGINQKGT
uniref:BSD domain-containing protein n=1 Tax=Brassica campestris TaxID=3711 RepID=M4DTR2_BRACM